jgi:hypothetical protein
VAIVPLSMTHSLMSLPCARSLGGELYVQAKRSGMGTVVTLLSLSQHEPVSLRVLRRPAARLLLCPRGHQPLSEADQRAAAGPHRHPSRRAAHPPRAALGSPSGRALGGQSGARPTRPQDLGDPFRRHRAPDQRGHGFQGATRACCSRRRTPGARLIQILTQMTMDDPGP